MTDGQQIPLLKKKFPFDIMSEAVLSNFKIILILQYFVSPSFPLHHKALNKAIWLVSIKTLVPVSITALTYFCFCIPLVEQNQKVAIGKAG